MPLRGSFVLLLAMCFVYVFSTLALSIGVGFMISAAASYIMSKRLGLIDARTGEES